jgi:1-aminocyclopropane-1-carboxylate deaminase/D-cysteine desulfhydrase-like pyridoxal-dependent ACC family enzyme
MQKLSFDIPIEHIEDETTIAASVNLYVLRLDLNHPDFGGNKIFKLKYNIEEARRQGKKCLLTFGGAYSNHIAATAAAGRVHGFKTVGIIRGEESSNDNPTLKFASEQGMELHFVSREMYRSKDGFDFFSQAQFSQSEILKFSNSFIIPEGGANEHGISGCREITDHITIDYDHVCCPCGTGTTIAGIILALKDKQSALGFQVLKGENYIRNEVKRWLDQFGHPPNNWNINEDYHFGGYAKRTAELIAFIEKFEFQHKIPLDFIYTGKMMFGIYDLMRKKYFKEGKTIIAIHTGGLQGNQGFNNK